MAAGDLDNTNWKLTSYIDGAAMRELPPDAEVTLTFQDGRAGGRSACNRYSGTATIGDETLTFGQMLSTKMACQPPVMEIEDKYLRALESVATWRLADDKLELQDGAGRTLLEFARG